MEFSNLSISVEELPNFKEAELAPISKKYLFLLWLNIGIQFLFFAGILLGLNFFMVEFPKLFLGLGAGIFFLILLLQAIEIHKGFPKRKFGIRELDIIFQKGFFFFKETVIPFKRIQHVEIKQGPILRLLNLYSLKLYTAGASTGDLVISGLSLAVAEKLKAKVLQVTEEDEA